MRARGGGFKRGVEVAGPLASLQLARLRRCGPPLDPGWACSPLWVVEPGSFGPVWRLARVLPRGVVSPLAVLGFVPSSPGV